MSLAMMSPAWRLAVTRGLRATVPALLLGAVVVVVWWAGPWLLLPALIAVASWRAPDPARVRVAIEMLAAALVLALAAVAVLVDCARGRPR